MRCGLLKSQGRFIYCCPQLLAALMLLTFTGTLPAQKGDSTRNDVVKIGQTTGDNPFEGQIQEVLKDQGRAKRLVATAVKMAQAKDPDLTYTGGLILGKVAAELKDYPSCESLYRVAMVQSVKLYSIEKIKQSYGGLIDILYDNKKYADSVRICRELVEIKTGDETPRKFKFPIETRFGELDFVDDPDFDLAKPMKSSAYQIMIQAMAKDGKLDQALKLTDNLVRASEHWRERQLRGWVLREAGRNAEAAKAYEDVIERIAKDKELTQKGKDFYTDKYSYLLSGIYVDAKQIDKAAEHLQALIDRNPDDAGYHNDLGYIWADNDMHLEKAEKLVRTALDLDRKQRKESPDFNPATDQENGSYLDSLGWVLFKQKRYGEAKKILLEALNDKKAQHIEIFDHLGETYMALGERKAALDAWQRGLEVAGEDRREQERKAEVEKKIQKYKK